MEIIDTDTIDKTIAPNAAQELEVDGDGATHFGITVDGGRVGRDIEEYRFGWRVYIEPDGWQPRGGFQEPEEFRAMAYPAPNAKKIEGNFINESGIDGHYRINMFSFTIE